MISSSPPALPNASSCDAALFIENARFAYAGQPPVIDGLSAQMKKGGIAAVLGANGCGKSTLLSLLVGAITPQSGKILAYGKLAFVPQMAEIAFDYSVLDVVLMGRARLIGAFSVPGKKDHEAARLALSHFGLADFSERSFRALSGGERQLVLLARALLAEAEVLLLDEPAAALDIRHQALVLQWLYRLSRDFRLTVLFTTHHPRHAQAIADHALLMFGANDYLWASAHEALSEENLKRLYRSPIARVPFVFNGKAMETLTPVFDLDDEGKV